MLNKIIFTALFVSLMSIASNAQVPEQCKSMKYAEHYKKEPTRLMVKSIAGTVKLEDNDHIRVSSCVAVYEEATKKLVKVVFLELKQRFDIKGIPDGEYRIVVREKDGYFCISNVPVKVDSSVVEKVAIKIEVKRPGVDTCEYKDIDN